jgi:hypothetical protein
MAKSWNRLAVAQIAIEGIAHGHGAFAPWSLTSVQQENIPPPVLIEIEKRDPAILGFDQVSIRRLAVEVLPSDSGRLGDVGEDIAGSLSPGLRGRRKQDGYRPRPTTRE